MNGIRARDVLFAAAIATVALVGTELLFIGGRILYKKVRS